MLTMHSASRFLLALILVEAFGNREGKLDRTCSKLEFRFPIDGHGFTHEIRENGLENPVHFKAGCPQSQHCLFVRDDTIANIFLASNDMFATFENFYSSNSPQSGSAILKNSEIIHDHASKMYVDGLGLYLGRSGIGEYKAVPHYTVSHNMSRFGAEEILGVSADALAAKNLYLVLNNTEIWKHMEKPMAVPWRMELNYYPCSIVQKSLKLALEKASLQAFADSAGLNRSRTMGQVCDVILKHCNGTHKQYNSSWETCFKYMSSLPMHDRQCQRRNGEFAAQGESFMCKYLHHFMVPMSPDLHCYHAGRSGVPDSDGKMKCSKMDCADGETPETGSPVDNVEAATCSSLAKGGGECTRSRLDELNTAAIYALPYCMPALNMGHAFCEFRGNCTQAINTFLGRFVENGIFCACHKAVEEEELPLASRLLSRLQVDASTLLLACRASTYIFDFPGCLTHGLAQNSESLHGCKHPEHIQTRFGCQKFDFERLSTGMLLEWQGFHSSAALRKQSRMTASNAVAKAECSVYSQWHTLRHNLHSNSHVLKHLTSNSQTEPIWESDLYLHPGAGRVAQSYREVLAMMQSDQHRSWSSLVAGACQFGTHDLGPKLPFWMPSLPIFLDTGSQLHQAVRELVWISFPGLALPMHDRFLPSDHPLPKDDKQSIRSAVAFAAVSLLLGVECAASCPPKWKDIILDYCGLVENAFVGESYHRAHGYIMATAYVRKRQTLIRALRTLRGYSQDELSSRLAHLGLNISVKEAEIVLVDLIPGAAFILPKMVEDIITMVRNDPCRFLPLWFQDPRRFVIEHARLFPGVTGFRAAPHQHGAQAPGAEQHSFWSYASANLDEEVFDDPLTFNPQRNLQDVLAWNVLQQDADDPRSDVAEGSTKARMCHGRNFSIEFAVMYAPHFFPQNLQCSHGSAVHDGVVFAQDLLKVDDRAGNSVEVEVYKVVQPDVRHTLLLFIHGAHMVPQGWSGVISEIDMLAPGRFDFWAVTPPGWGRSTRMEVCRFDDAAELIQRMLLHSAETWDSIYLIGHDFGALIAWTLAHNLQSQVSVPLKGLISTFPHPEVYRRAMESKSPGMSGLAQLSPIMGSIYAAVDDHEYSLDSVFENATWWTAEWKATYLRQYQRTGAHALSCYSTGNVGLQDGTLTLLSNTDDLDPHTNMLFLEGPFGNTFPHALFEASLLRVPPQAGHFIQHSDFVYAGFLSALFEKPHRNKVAQSIAEFVESTQMLEYSVLGQFVLPPNVQKGANAGRYTEDIAVLYVVLLSLIEFSAGMTLEYTVGPVFLTLSWKQEAWVLAQALMPVLTAAATLSGSFGLMPLFLLGLFKLGFPEILTGFLAVKKIRVEGERLIGIRDFISAIFRFNHHFWTCICFNTIILGLQSPLIVTPVWIILLEHVVSNVRYLSPGTFIIITTVLEVWMQVEFFATKSLYHWIFLIGAWGILVTHWWMTLSTITEWVVGCLQKPDERRTSDVKLPTRNTSAHMTAELASFVHPERDRSYT